MTDLQAPRPLAVVTGASSGIGYNLARIAAEHGYDLVVAADTPLTEAVSDFESLGAKVDSLQVDLSTTDGVHQLLALVGNREVDALIANAGHGLGGAFLDQSLDAVRHVIDTNVTGTVHLIHHIANAMRRRVGGVGHGRILITGSVAGFMPGSFQAVYNGTKAFVDSFSLALRNELKDTRITVTCLMPGPTDTEFFVRADMLDTKVNTDKKADPADVARIGFDAMLKGEADVVAGLKNKIEVALNKVMPAQMSAQMHRRLAEPGTGEPSKENKE